MLFFRIKVLGKVVEGYRKVKVIYFKRIFGVIFGFKECFNNFL